MGSKNFTISELADQTDLLSKPLSDHAGTGTANCDRWGRGDALSPTRTVLYRKDYSCQSMRPRLCFQAGTSTIQKVSSWSPSASSLTVTPCPPCFLLRRRRPISSRKGLHASILSWKAG
jgi:hypothetical protein